ncbi:hypothetical protein BJX70DRAFT_227400 [Aspergillus crustosus]
MRFTLNILALLASTAAAAPATSGTPSSTPSSTPTSTPSPSATINPDDFSCIIANRGCNWEKSDYTYGADHCGSSVYQPFQVLDEGSIVLAVAQNGTAEDGCVDQTTEACCRALQDESCRRGERWLQCYP